MPRLENWKICESPSQDFIAPEIRKRFINGNVYGHSKFNEGVPVNTSILLSIDIANRVAVTKNSVYELGEMDPEYKKWYEKNIFESEDHE